MMKFLFFALFPFTLFAQSNRDSLQSLILSLKDKSPAYIDSISRILSYPNFEDVNDASERIVFERGGTPVEFLPNDRAEKLAYKFAPHFAWDSKEIYYHINPFNLFFIFAPDFFNKVDSKYLICNTPFYSGLDSSGNYITSPFLPLAWPLIKSGANIHHLGWGPFAVNDPIHGERYNEEDYQSYEITEFPCYYTDLGRELYLFGHIPFWMENTHFDEFTPIYYYAFINSNNNIELNYRYFAYRDDIYISGGEYQMTEDHLGGHWGDWEPNITIVLNQDEEPLYCYYSAHKTDDNENHKRLRIDSPYHPRYLLWEDVKKTTSGRPIVLVAGGKHAAYYPSMANYPIYNNIAHLLPQTSNSIIFPNVLNIYRYSTPNNNNAKILPSFLNYIYQDIPSKLSFLGLVVERVGESYWPLPLPPNGDLTGFYYGRHLIPQNIVNFNNTELLKFKGKWGESSGSPWNPSPVEHTVKDFVLYYRHHNYLPKYTENIPIKDYYDEYGPIYEADLGLDRQNESVHDSASAHFHNIFYSILTPFEFENTKNVYNDIRFKWWNDIKLEPIMIMSKDDSVTFKIALINNEDFSILFYKGKWDINNSDSIFFDKTFSNQSFKSGDTYFEQITLLKSYFSDSINTISFSIYGDVTLPNNKSLSICIDKKTTTFTSQLLNEDSDVILNDFFPNPTSSSSITTILLKEKKYVNIEIIDQMGAVVKSLFSGEINSGMNQINWDGNDETGLRCGPGLYYCIVKTNNKIISKKIILN